MRTKIRNMITGASIDRTFHGSDKFERADVGMRKAQFVYKDGEDYNFMDMETYEQYPVKGSALGDKVKFLKEGMDVDVVNFEGRAIGVDLPIKVSYEVTETQPGIKGDTAQGGSKPATVETGAVITVPLFINTGEKIVVDTRDGSYVGRE